MASNETCHERNPRIGSSLEDFLEENGRLEDATDTAIKRVDQAIARLKALRKGCTLGGLSWKELRDEGRHPKREALPMGELSEADLQAKARAEVPDRYHDLDRELAGNPRPPGQGKGEAS